MKRGDSTPSRPASVAPSATAPLSSCVFSLSPLPLAVDHSPVILMCLLGPLAVDPVGLAPALGRDDLVLDEAVDVIHARLVLGVEHLGAHITFQGSPTDLRFTNRIKMLGSMHSCTI